MLHFIRECTSYTRWRWNKFLRFGLEVMRLASLLDWNQDTFFATMIVKTQSYDPHFARFSYLHTQFRCSFLLNFFKRRIMKCLNHKESYQKNHSEYEKKTEDIHMEIAHHNSAVEHQWTEESNICEIILNHIETIVLVK